MAGKRKPKTTIMTTKKPKVKVKDFEVEVTVDKLPKNCYECPFYYMTNPEHKDTWFEDWDCFLGCIGDNEYGIAVSRPKTCKLNKKKKESNEGKESA